MEKQLFQAKKDNKLLQDKLNTDQSVGSVSEAKSLERASVVPCEPEQPTGLVHQQSEAILNLQRQLKAERRSLKQLKSSKSNYFIERGELEDFFLECIENVRKEVIRRRLKATQKACEVSLQQFTETDQRRVLELLVSDERLLLLVHDRIFPSTKPPQTAFTPSKILNSRSYSHLSRQSNGLSGHKLGESYAASPFFTVQKSQRPSTAPRVFKK